MAEIDQEADTLTYHVTDMSIPRKVAVENDTKVFNILALPNGPATDPHADRGEISGILSGAKEEDFRFGRVEFKSVGMEPRCQGGEGRLHALDEVRKIALGIGNKDLGIVSVLVHMSVRRVLRSLAKMVNNRGPRADPWKTPMVLGRGFETTLPPEGEEMQTD